MIEMVKEEKQERMKTNARGITLIALVVTIIVLLILAGVTISLVVGQNGIITRAKEAGKAQEIAEEREKIQMEIMDLEAGELQQGNTLTREKIKEELIKKGIVTEVNIETGEIITKKGNSITDILDNYPSGGNTPDPTPVTPQVAVNTPATENSTINGQAGAYNNPVIPKGFKALETAQDSTITAEASWTSSTGWQNGLVIEDATGDSTTNGSQFVWVPVENYENFHLIDGYSSGSLQTLLNQATDPSREAGESLTAKLPGKPNEANTLLGTEESVAMYQSVKENGGFYIARYEMGIAGTTASTSTNDANKQTQDGSIKPVSKAGVGVWNFIPWGGTTAKEASDGEQGNDRANGAVKVARKMYNNPIEGDNNANTAVKSTLIYGVQWDAVMNFIDSNYVTGSCEANSFVKDSTGKGNYTSLATTGSNQVYQQKNIYDLAGNVYEWTMEACYSTYRVFRGGVYNYNGSFKPASSRSDNYPDYTNDGIGTRLTLYL